MRDNNNRAALINIDNTALEAYKRQREIARKTRSQEDRIDKIEKSIDEIKSLLVKLLENGNNK